MCRVQKVCSVVRKRLASNRSWYDALTVVHCTKLELTAIQIAVESRGRDEAELSGSSFTMYTQRRRGLFTCSATMSLKTPLNSAAGESDRTAAKREPQRSCRENDRNERLSKENQQRPPEINPPIVERISQATIICSRTTDGSCFSHRGQIHLKYHKCAQRPVSFPRYITIITWLLDHENLLTGSGPLIAWYSRTTTSGGGLTPDGSSYNLISHLLVSLRPANLNISESAVLE